ncbi:MAG: hypothetical protein VKJ04_02215 [Vampirovibrionales bacterium]|nr:hypothetical protein [Vampirovibrionales bacterium]
MTTPSSLPVADASLRLDPMHLPAFALYGQRQEENSDAAQAQGPGWELSPTPFYLSEGQFVFLNELGPLLLSFLETLDTLYKHSVSQTPVKGVLIPKWVSDYCHFGKPEALIQFSQMKRFRSQLPMVLRPDLLVTPEGFALTEIDSVPGGLGFVSALNQAYRNSGFEVLDGHLELGKTLPEAFLTALKAQVPELESPVIAIVVSDEAKDYLAEWQWLIDGLQKLYPNIHCVHPRQLDLVKDKLVAELNSGQDIQIDLLYRFFELFDLPNIPKVDLVEYALKKRILQGTPPFKPYLEEKMMMAFLHHPALADFWEAHLGGASFIKLKSLMPPSWLVDPSPLPPSAVIAGLEPMGRPVQSFASMGELSQKGRQLVLKPSGFSPLAWGSRGVTVGHDVPSEVWREKIAEALSEFEKTPYVLQSYQNPATQELRRMELKTGEDVVFKAKTRLCPYYFVKSDASGKLKTYLSGVLATACPADKKIIHGMRDAVLAPCSVRS